MSGEKAIREIQKQLAIIEAKKYYNEFKTELECIRTQAQKIEYVPMVRPTYFPMILD